MTPLPLRLLPTPMAQDFRDSNSPSESARKSPHITATKALFPMLPTPMASDWKDSKGPGENARNNPRLTAADYHFPDEAFGKYAPAVRRWESVTRPAPAPVRASARGNPILTEAFDEWMMGLPAGHLTAVVPPIPRKAVLKGCGNGVVPQQAAGAVRELLAIRRQVLGNL